MIEFQQVSKIYKGGKVAVEDVNLSFEKGEFICFIGTSGSGKTTCMRMINRMTDPSKGKILINGKSVTEINPVELRRQIGYVIQSIGLMPHMTIRENITLVQKLLKVSQEERNKTAERFGGIAARNARPLPQRIIWGPTATDRCCPCLGS